uniref:Protein-PII uridylyltransferase N-terminal domain-containing protein n=1 Tax=Branchiostoma floridae TaxID=7739 RepID=C3ZS62_BRAFL|eukprot:XP_002588583.1 hypothetical protein BRAFLDRAFT_107532 [Branchiostoma floridae]
MLRVCEKLREADAKGRRYGLARAETGYLCALVDAVADKDRLAEVELLKSLGDVNLEKGRLEKDVGKFNMALALYVAAIVRCCHRDQGEGIEHRYEYAERLLQEVTSKGSQDKEQKTEDKEKTTPAKVALKFQNLDKKQATGGSTDSLLTGHAELMLEGIVNDNNMLETEAIKSLGDVYLKRGTETGDTRHLTRATALYNTALARCNNVQGTVVIVHRLLHTAKLRQDITTKRKNNKMSCLFSAPELQKAENPSGAEVDNVYDEHLQNGCRALQTGDLDTAEQSFAAALKSVHVQGQYRREAEPLYKLAEIYMNRGIWSKDGGDFAKAAALCNAALVRSSREYIELEIKEITHVFVKEVLKIEQKVDSDDPEKNKLMLKVDRDYVQEEIKRIEQEVDPYSLDDEDPKIKEVEMKRVEAIKSLCQTLVHQRKVFIAGLVDECMKVMGPPPCKYAMIGLGSHATGLVTPYSDLEFAILVDKETENDVSYFRNLTHYLHLKVINLGETILPAMGIKSLNDFYSDDPLDSWFYDSVTPRGFAFDGAMPHACKTPLGRGRNSTRTSELIRTPSNMTKVLKEDLTLHLKKGYHLASILGNVSHITGDQSLVDEYRSLWTQQLQNTNDRVPLNLGDHEKVVRYYEQSLQMKQSLYGKDAAHPDIAVSIKNLGDACKNLGDHRKAISYHFQALQMMRIIYGEDTAHPLIVATLNSLGGDWSDLGDNRKAVSYYKQALQMDQSIFGVDTAHPTIASLLNNLGIAWRDLGDHRKAVSYYEQSLQMRRSIYGKGTAHPDIANSLSSLGTVWSCLGDHRKAIRYYEQALEMMRSIYGEENAHPDIATSLNNLGIAWRDLGDHRKAVSYFEQSLQMKRSIYGEGTAHPAIATSLNNLGIAWSNLGDHRKAISYWEQALQMNRSVYGEDTQHPDIAGTLNNLGAAWSSLGDHRKAISYHERSLQIYRSISGEGTVHPEIASSLNNLGNAWSYLGDHRKAVSYFEQSLQMMRSIYGGNTAHPYIVKSLKNLRVAWRELGDYGKAIYYFQLTEQMKQVISSFHSAGGGGKNKPSSVSEIMGETIWCNKYIRSQEYVLIEKLRVADAKGRRYGLARAETGYLRALVDAVADKDRLAEVELLKSLGDVNLEKGRLGKDRGKFNMAMALYVAAIVRCHHRDQGEGIEHRYKYAERLLQGVTSKGSQDKEQQTENKEKTSPAKVAKTFQNMDKKRATGCNTDIVLVGYAQLMVEGIVNDNNMLETEAIKSLGDVYLKRGTETGDTRDLTKATALYNTALARCNNVQGTVAIVHRLLYTAKIRQDITTKSIKKSTRTKRQQNVRGRKDHISPFSTATLNDSTNDQMHRLHSVYKEHLHDGCRALQTGDLDKAEESFAAALKSVHVQGQHRKEAEPLYKLGNVYLKRGIQSKDGGDFTKAAALCNAALVRSSREDIVQASKEIVQAFVKEVLKIGLKVDSDNTERHKLMLKADRDYVEKEIKKIEQEVDPYSLDDEDPKIKEVEMKRVEAIKALCQTIVHQRNAFIAGLVDECMNFKVMGRPPCKYAMIGLGSQATGLVTPYSDLEFAILVEDEAEPNVSYFRNLTHYLHLKVINLGETILPAMGIKSLNDFYSGDPLDSWFYDSVTPRGFAFDGAMRHACKTPLGRGRNGQLIHTPSNMTNVLKEDLTLHLKKGYHLASILGNISLITGEQGLVDSYRSLLTQQLRNNDGRVSLVMANELLGDITSTFHIQPLTTKLRNVKKEIYRFSSLAVFFWALLHNIQPTTIWETVQELRNSKVVTSNNAHHLMVLVSISAELRLRTYMNNGGQVENMSVLWSMSTDTGIEEKLQKVFYISNTKQLMRYYYTERPLKHFISQLTDTKPEIEPPIFFDNSSELKAEVYESLCDFENLKTCSEQTLHSYLSKYGKNTAHSDVASSLDTLAFALGALGNHKKAIRYYEQSLQMKRSIYGEDTAHPDIALSLKNFGDACGNLGDHRQAISYHEQALQMTQNIHGEDTAHPDITATLNSLGAAWSYLGDHRKAISYYEQSLQMTRSIYGVDTAHNDIAASLNNLGSTWRDLGDHRKAVSYYEQSLQMRRSMYGEGTTHPDIASSLNNLGAAWGDLDDHRKAVSYYEQSLKMNRSIYGEGNVHPAIASLLNNLGTTWGALGDHRNAVSYYEHALQMRRSIYGEDTAHPDIASSLNNLGNAWGDLDDNRKAVSYYEQSLQMNWSMYGVDTVHPGIASLLNNLGNTWGALGDHRKAVTIMNTSLQMSRSIYGEDTAHPDIASSLNMLGNAWGDLGDHRKA